MRPGNKVRLFISENNVNNKLMHVLAVVDEDYVVYKSWSRRRQSWNYQVEYIYLFELFNKEGWLTLV